MRSPQRLQHVVVCPLSNTHAEDPAPNDAPQVPPLLHRIFAVFCGIGSLRARYTVAKLRDFDHYARTTSTLRHAAVILLTPLPSLITSLLPTLIQLQDPTRGVLANTGYMVHFFTALDFVAWGSVFQIRAPCRISHRDISNRDALLIAVLTSLMLTVFVTLLGLVWRFPVPFIWITAYVPYILLLVLAHVMVLRRKLWRNDTIRGPLLAFLPSYFMQGFQVVVYPAFSALFEMSTELGQVALTLLFPFIKYTFRRILRILSSHLLEDADEVAVSGVEICAAMYQSMIMQSTPSAYATALVIGLDVVQGLFSIHVFMDKTSVVRLCEVVPKALAIVREQSTTIVDKELKTYATIKTLPRLRLLVLPLIQLSRRWRAVAPLTSSDTIVLSLKPAAPRPLSTLITIEDKQILTHALEIVQSAESILIVEYFEVSVPVVNAVFLLWSSQFASAIYNPKIRPYYDDNSRLSSAIQSLGFYTILQLLSVVVMHVVMWRRFRMSTTVLLAYVLERHAWSLQGKLITWLSAIFQLPVLHYGVDFKLKFDFSAATPSN